MSDQAYAKVQAQQKTLNGSTSKSSLLQRTCACGQHTNGGECEKCKEKREGTLQRAAVNSSPVHEIPPIVHDVLRSPGQPLDAATRAFVEPRFGHDFSHVRVHTDASAAASAQAVRARAYTTGHNVVFGAGQYVPHSADGRSLIIHELTHVLQHGPTGKPEGVADTENPLEHEARRAAASANQHRGRSLEVHPRAAYAGPPLIWRAADPTAAATYPTAGERTRVQEILNPQQQKAAATGTPVPKVSDPAGFQSHMAARLNPYIDQVLASAQRIKASGVVLGLPELQGLGDIAQTQVTSFYGTYLTAAVHNPAEQAARAGYQLRTHLHEVPSVFSAKTDPSAKGWVASRMHVKGADLLESYHVLSGDDTARDQKLFEDVRDFIFNNRAADLRTIILFFPGYESGGEAYIQRRLVPEVGEAPDETRRRGRWQTLGTTIHEMLHAVAHEDFRPAAEVLEESGIAVEGFAEYFTRPVYDRLSERAANETALRTSIEGKAAPYMRPPDRTGYSGYFEAVKRLRDILGGNEENLKVAYFMGRIEFLGLGGWNEAEAARRRFPANTLGVAALLTDSGQGYFRVQYTRVVLGRGGAFQIQLGGMLGYLTQNQRLGLGGSAYLQYSWPNVYLRGGLDVAGSTSLGRPFGESVRLDLIPGVEVGVPVGIVRVGASAHLIVPVAGGPISDRTARLAAGLGLSVSF